VQDLRRYDITRLEAGVVQVELEDPSGATHVVEVASGQFEPAEHGVVLGRVFVPWHRVGRYWWELGTREIAPVGERPPLARVRVVLDDGTPEGETYIVAGDHFETGPYAVTVVLEDRVDLEKGVVVLRKLCVPWRHVVEFERLRINVAAVLHEGESVPERPDGA
jgi:hypothetical protein